MDIDHVLICQVFTIAHQTAKLLLSSDLKTPKSDDFLENLMVDQNNNVQAVFEVNGEQHVITLNAKLTGRGITHYMPFYIQILHVLDFFSLS